MDSSADVAELREYRDDVIKGEGTIASAVVSKEGCFCVLERARE